MDSDGKVIEDRNAGQSHTAKFKCLAVSARVINQAIALAVPLDTPANVAAFFGNRASVNTIRSWRNGNRYVPQWAIEMLRTHGASILARADMLPTGPGSQAGWRNVKGYQLNMRR